MTARGRLIETVNGVPIYAKARPEDDAMALLPGRRGRLMVGGPVYVVDRIGSGAAYVHKVYDPPQERRVGPWDKIDALVGPVLAAITDGTPNQAYGAAFRLADVGRKCSTIYVSRGPAEPGIAPGSRFIDRAPDGDPEATPAIPLRARRGRIEEGRRGAA